MIRITVTIVRVELKRVPVVRLEARKRVFHLTRGVAQLMERRMEMLIVEMGKTLIYLLFCGEEWGRVARAIASG